MTKQAAAWTDMPTCGQTAIQTGRQVRKEAGRQVGSFPIQRSARQLCHSAVHRQLSASAFIFTSPLLEFPFGVHRQPSPLAFPLSTPFQHGHPAFQFGCCRRLSPSAILFSFGLQLFIFSFPHQLFHVVFLVSSPLLAFVVWRPAPAFLLNFLIHSAYLSLPFATGSVSSPSSVCLFSFPHLALHFNCGR